MLTFCRTCQRCLVLEFFLTRCEASIQRHQLRIASGHRRRPEEIVCELVAARAQAGWLREGSSIMHESSRALPIDEQVPASLQPKRKSTDEGPESFAGTANIRNRDNCEHS